MQISKYKKRNLVLRFPLLLQMYFKKEKNENKKNNMLLGLFSHSANIIVKGKKEKKKPDILSSPGNSFLKKETQYTGFFNLIPQIFSEAGSLHLLYKACTLVQLVVQGLYTCPTPARRYLPQIHC